MADSLHVLTKDYPENQANGILVCGINFGYSAEDEARDASGSEASDEAPSFFSDSAVNSTRFRNRIVKWLNSWDVGLATEAGKEGALERAFFQTNWLCSQTNDAKGITHRDFVDNAKGILQLLEARKPRLIIFVGASLIEAFNDIDIREQVTALLGERSGNAVVHRGDLDNYTGTHFKVLSQSFGPTQIISLPHTQTQGLSDEYMASFKQLIHPLVVGG